MTLSDRREQSRTAAPPPQAERAVPLTDRRATHVLMRVGLLVVLLGAAQLLIPAFGIHAYVLPTPDTVIGALAHDYSTLSFWHHIGTTMSEIMLGWAVGCITGLVLGVLIAEFRLVEITLTPYIVALNAVPKVALAPVLVVVFGYGVVSKVVITAIMAFFPLLVNVGVGLRGADALQLEMMRGLRASRWQTLRWVKFPGAMPAIFAGIEVAVVLGVVGAIVGEFTGAESGLGYVILQRSFSMDQGGVFSALVTLALIGIVLDLIVRWVGRRVVRWQ